MRPSWDPKSPSLLPTIVCYADILGFSAMIERAHGFGKETEFLQRIKHSLAAAYDIVRKASTLDGATTSDFDMKVFTDNIVVAYPLRAPNWDHGEPELGTLLMLFAQVQASLASDGFYLRGAVAAGDHYQDDDIAYGKALLEAVNLDKSGGPPRLVIGPSIEPLIREQLSSYGNGGWATHYEQLLEDPHDERLFVNYLDVAFDFFPDGPIDYQLLSRHKENVLRGLKRYESDSSVREKYEWTATYHNYVCLTFADRYSSQDHEGVDLEQMAIAEEAQRALKYQVPLEDQSSEPPLRRLDAERLRRRLAARETLDAPSEGSAAYRR